MPDLEVILEEIARGLLNRGQGEGLPPTLEGLRRTLRQAPGEGVTPTWAVKPAPSLPGQPPLPLREEARDQAVGKEGSLDSKLRECRNRFERKVHEVQELKRRLAQARREAEQARRERDRAREEAAHARKRLAQLEEEQGELVPKLARCQDGLAALEAKVASMQAARAELEARLARAEALLEEAAWEREEGRRLREELERLRSWQGRLPEPFPQEALFRLLVLDYPRFGEDAQARIQALLEAYQSLLEGRDHPILAKHSNLPFLEGHREGLVLLGAEVLLQDLTALPLLRWVRTHALRLESFLNPKRAEGEG